MQAVCGCDGKLAIELACSYGPGAYSAPVRRDLSCGGVDGGWVDAAPYDAAPFDAHLDADAFEAAPDDASRLDAADSSPIDGAE